MVERTQKFLSLSMVLKHSFSVWAKSWNVHFCEFFSNGGKKNKFLLFFAIYYVKSFMLSMIQRQLKNLVLKVKNLFITKFTLMHSLILHAATQQFSTSSAAQPRRPPKERPPQPVSPGKTARS